MTADQREDQIYFALLITVLSLFVYPGSFLIRAFTDMPLRIDSWELLDELRISLWFVIAVTLAIAVPKPEALE